MHTVKPATMRKIAPLFSEWEETMIWSCLEGCMGIAFADVGRHPSSAQIMVADFCFYAGKPAMELVLNLPKHRRGLPFLMVPENEAWAEMIEQVYAERVRRVTRYATRKEHNLFDRDRLEAYAHKLPGGYSLCPIDEALYETLKSQAWSASLCEQFATAQEYVNHGIGVVALCDGVPVSGASSYTYYRGGIEVEVDTQEFHRRMGLARACAAKLILTCMDRGLYPSWDAQNPGSLQLALQLGYHEKGPYTAFEFLG